MEELKDYNHMLTEFEAIKIFHDVPTTFHVHAASVFLESLEYLNLDVGIIYIELFILTKFGSDNSSSRIFVIYALDNLSESSLVNNLDNFISVSKLFTNRGQVVSFFICYRILILTSDLSYCVNATIYSKLNLFKFR